MKKEKTKRLKLASLLTGETVRLCHKSQAPRLCLSSQPSRLSCLPRASVPNSSTLNHELRISSMKQRASGLSPVRVGGRQPIKGDYSVVTATATSSSFPGPVSLVTDLKEGKAALGVGSRGMRGYQLKPQISQCENKEVLSPSQTSQQKQNPQN